MNPNWPHPPDGYGTMPVSAVLDMAADEPKKTHRGTTNRNVRGSAETRRRRKAWLIETYLANQSLFELVACDDLACTMPHTYSREGKQHAVPVPACRCYRCGKLLSAATVTVDRIKPGCQGGTYIRSNCRPACGPCNSETGATVRQKGTTR